MSSNGSSQVFQIHLKNPVAAISLAFLKAFDWVD